MTIPHVHKTNMNKSTFRCIKKSIFPRQVNLKISPQLRGCFNWSMFPQSELVVFARVSDPAVDLETTPPDGPWLEATASAVPWSLGVDIAIWNAVGMLYTFHLS